MDQFKALFLPVGFPDTVKDNYVRYSAMAALTNLLISTNMTLSSALLLYAVGLGSAAVPMAGALNWVIKEGVGQAGALSTIQPRAARSAMCTSPAHPFFSSTLLTCSAHSARVCAAALGRIPPSKQRGSKRACNGCRHAAAGAHGGARL